MLFNGIKKIFPQYSHWYHPKLSLAVDDKFERKATWLELFFDISFVAAVTEISTMLAHNYSLSGILEYALLYTPIWWLWIGMTFYSDRFDNGKSIDRLFVFLMMLPVAGMSVSIHNGIYANVSTFISYYIISRVLLIFLWIRAGYFNPNARSMAKIYIVGFIASIIIWIFAMYCNDYWQLFFWILALGVEFITPLIALNAQSVHVPKVNSSHLNERFGLFTIIVLAEIFLGVLHGVSILPIISLKIAIISLLGFTVCFCLWSIYFDDVIAHVGFPKQPWNIVWVYTHLPLTLSITAIGAALIHIIAYQSVDSLIVDSYLLSTTVAVTLLCIAFIEFAHNKGVAHHDSNHTEKICIQLRFIGAFLCLLVGYVFASFPTIIVISFLSIIMIHQVWQGLVSRKS